MSVNIVQSSHPITNVIASTFEIVEFWAVAPVVRSQAMVEF